MKVIGDSLIDIEIFNIVKDILRDRNSENLSRPELWNHISKQIEKQNDNSLNSNTPCIDRMIDRILYLWDKGRIQKKEKNSITPKRKRSTRSQGIRLPYPKEMRLKTVQIRYDQKLSSLAKFLLNSFKNKYLYYAIDDILYSLKSNPVEKESLLELICSPVLSVHNNKCINFFDIWIWEVYVTETSKVNRFLTNESQNLEQCTYITIKLGYQTREPVKKMDSLW